MSVGNLFRLICILMFLASFAMSTISCRPDENPSEPGGGGGTGGGIPKGSGTMRFIYSGYQTGSLSLSGNGFWPPSGTGVAATIDSTGKRLQIVGYKQLTSAKIGHTAGAHFAFVVIEVYDASGIAAITYGNTNSDITLQVGIDVDTTHADSLSFHSTSGSITIDSKTSSQMTGTFSCTATRPSDGATITIQSGTFTVQYITGTILSEGGSSGGIGGRIGLSPYGAFPIPFIPNLNGILGVVDVISTASGFTTEAKTAFGGFYQSSTASNVFVYGGSVFVNGSELDTVRNDQNVIYLLPSQYHPNDELNVTFNGTSTASFEVFGNTSVPSFTTNITAPGLSTITSPAANAQVSRSSLTIKWNSTTTTDSIFLVVNQGSHMILKSGLTNNGSYTVSASDLRGFQTGPGLIFLVKYRYTTRSVTGNKYAAIAETVNQRQINFY